MHELEMLSQLSHPNLVSYFGYSIHKNEFYLVTEYMSLGSLKDLVKSIPQGLHEKAIFHVVLSVANGLSYLHSCSVFHKDITTSNVLVSGERYSFRHWNVKLSDLGISETSSSPVTPLTFS